MRFAGRFMQAAVDAGTAIGRSRRTAIDPNTIRRLASARPAARAAAPKAIQAVMPEAESAAKAVASTVTRAAPQPRVLFPGLEDGRRDTPFNYRS
jgi:hypothetical protein